MMRRVLVDYARSRGYAKRGGGARPIPLDEAATVSQERSRDFVALDDALKSHAILVKTAEQFGGVVYPPVYFHSGFNRDALAAVLTDLFDRLKRTGFRVIMGVSGHNVAEQIDMINDALRAVTADGTVAGMGLWEVTLSQCEESNTDHAAKWETSYLWYLRPDCVDMSLFLRREKEPLVGVYGEDPRQEATVEIGRKGCDLIVEGMIRKAASLMAP